MRTTQFIGLTNRAEQMVKNLVSLPSDSTTQGMFDESIPLRKWIYKGVYLREVVQVVPWSSGPMIFTCLEWEFENGGKTKCLEWFSDPTLENEEYNREIGGFWV